MDDAWLINRMLFFIPLLLSLTIHEWAHAWSASRLGDDTAERLGRLTLNPVVHMDPIGTLLLPLLGVPFGWAKPVPVDPLRFNRGVSMRTGMMITAAAGPISNACIAAACIAVLVLLNRYEPEWLWAEAELRSSLRMLLLLNVVLAAFNLLPIPPLDGSRVADALMPEALRPAWNAFQSLGPVALLIVILLPMLSGVSLFRWPLQFADSLVNQLSTMPVPF